MIKFVSIYISYVSMCHFIDFNQYISFILCSFQTKVENQMSPHLNDYFSAMFFVRLSLSFVTIQYLYDYRVNVSVYIHYSLEKINILAR